MDGIQNSQQSNDSSQFNPKDRTDNPPSLVEPSARQRPVPDDMPVPSPDTDDTAIVENAGTPAAVEPPAQPVSQPEPSSGFFNPDGPDVSDQSDGSDTPGAPDTDAGYEDSESNHTIKTPHSTEEVVSWTSSGDELRGYSASWLSRMSLAGVMAGGLVYLVTRELVTSLVIAVAGIAFGFLGSRTPHSISYQIDRMGISVGQKRYSYSSFRSFAVAEGAMPTIVLAPLQRFMPILAIRIDTAQTDNIVGLLAQHLPLEVHRPDLIERLTSKLKI